MERLKEESWLLEVLREILFIFQPSLSDRQKICWHMAGNAVSVFVEHEFFNLTTF